ncbi:MAG: CerR family C-terminal domain-containing protein [bacterium]|nr:CerR family C-terminal domain-containing protein [bacterium]
MKDTRQSLLESACSVFAERGFQDANVADICKRAKANIASINYHFGGKRKLYEEVLQYTAEVAEREYPLIPEGSESTSPEDRLTGFIRAQFLRSHCDGLAGCFDRILTHEFTKPTFAHDTLFRKVMHGRRDRMIGLLRELLPPGTDEPHLRICIHNIRSLCAFQKFARARRERHAKKCGPHLPPPEVLARFAATFALAGIRAIAETPLEDSEDDSDTNEVTK